MLSAICFNLEQSKILSSGDGLTYDNLYDGQQSKFGDKRYNIISCLPVGYREISVKLFFDLTLVTPVKKPIFLFLFPGLIARASQPDGNTTSFILHFSRLT